MEFSYVVGDMGPGVNAAAASCVTLGSDLCLCVSVSMYVCQSHQVGWLIQSFQTQCSTSIVFLVVAVIALSNDILLFRQ